MKHFHSTVHPIALFGRWFVLCLALLSLAGGTAAAAAENSRLSLPNSHRDRPFDAPVLLAFHAALGGGLDYDCWQPGYGASFIFRPGAGDRFLDFLYGLNTAMVLQADHQRVAADLRILSADLILRRYLVPFADPAVPTSLFVGAGVGGSQITVPPDLGGGRDSNFSLVFEAGQEWNLKRGVAAFWKVQLRRYKRGGVDFSTYALQAGVGLPLPW